MDTGYWTQVVLCVGHVLSRPTHPQPWLRLFDTFSQVLKSKPWFLQFCFLHSSAWLLASLLSPCWLQAQLSLSVHPMDQGGIPKQKHPWMNELVIGTWGTHLSEPPTPGMPPLILLCGQVHTIALSSWCFWLIVPLERMNSKANAEQVRGLMCLMCATFATAPWETPLGPKLTDLFLSKDQCPCSQQLLPSSSWKFKIN